MEAVNTKMIIKEKEATNVIGPFTQVYGAGLVVYYLIVPKAKSNLQVFLVSMVLGGIVEYLFSYFQEYFFGTISWDYSNLWFNLNGRTSLLHCIYWGTGGILFMKFIYQLVQKLDNIYKSCNLVTLHIYII